jgi:hypothetical protein
MILHHLCKDIWIIDYGVSHVLACRLWSVDRKRGTLENDFEQGIVLTSSGFFFPSQMFFFSSANPSGTFSNSS